MSVMKSTDAPLFGQIEDSCSCVSTESETEGLCYVLHYIP